MAIHVMAGCARIELYYARYSLNLGKDDQEWDYLIF